METYKVECDVLILGGGPGGYVAAERAAQLGLNVVLVEKEKVGGVCLHHGCIPSKALLDTAEKYAFLQECNTRGVALPQAPIEMPILMAWKDQILDRLHKGVETLLSKRSVKVIQGTGFFKDAHTLQVTQQETNTEISFKQAIIATGAKPRELPQVPVNGRNIITSREMLDQGFLPKRVLIVGGGASGCEFTSFYTHLGSEVVLVEVLEHLMPLEDVEVSKRLEGSFRKKKIKLFLKTSVDSVKEVAKGLEVSLSSGQTVETDQVLVCAGYVRHTQNLGLEKADVKLEKNGSVVTNEFLQTSQKHIYAIGDVTSSYQLAHVASYEGLVAVDNIAKGNKRKVSYAAIPRCVFCSPEVASVGLTKDQAGQGAEEKKVLFNVLGKAQATGQSEGFVKLVYDPKSLKLLGAHCVGPHVTELIGELGLAVRLGLTVKDLDETVHAHPTFSEVIAEVAALICGHPIHATERP